MPGNKRWTQVEKNFVRQNYTRMTDKEIAQAIWRATRRRTTEDAVKLLRRQVMGLVKPWSSMSRLPKDTWDGRQVDPGRPEPPRRKSTGGKRKKPQEDGGEALGEDGKGEGSES